MPKKPDCLHLWQYAWWNFKPINKRQCAFCRKVEEKNDKGNWTVYYP
jgi:hypothetical protein